MRLIFLIVALFSTMAYAFYSPSSMDMDDISEIINTREYYYLQHTDESRMYINKNRTPIDTDKNYNKRLAISQEESNVAWVQSK